MKKSELNQNIHLSEGNIKSKCDDNTTFLTWSLPSRKCCPYATEMCKKRCFAKKNETFKGVRDSRERNLEETQKESFVRDMINHFEYHLQRPKNKDRQIIVRIHTSGDFYNQEYFDKWVQIAKHFKVDNRIMFQAYTKSIRIVWNWIIGELNESFISEKDIQDGWDEINIHIVYSIWKDTNVNDLEIATEWLNTEKHTIQTFTALPKQEIEEAVNNGCFLCNGDCGSCKECYTGTSKKIVIVYH